MTDENRDEASIFDSARKLPTTGERDSYLSQACGDDIVLRKRVEKLLAAFVEESQFLEHPAAKLPLSQESPTSSASQDFEATFTFNPAFPRIDQSVLQELGSTLDEVPRVSLREAGNSGEDPIVRPNSPELPASSSHGRYRLDGEIARGGMGAVLKGRDVDLGRDLAIKVLLGTHQNNPQVVQRFIEEAQIGGQLQHPGIAPVYELGQFDDKRPFFSMKLVKGETLAKLLSDRRDPSGERGKFIGIFEQICQTMAYAHSRGVIHRDLKPANIMVGAFGEVQVMDWGLAKVLPSGGVADEQKAQNAHQGNSVIQTMRSKGSDVSSSFDSNGSDTQMGSVMGTPAYMPPEQALGEIDQLDQRADVFGLGAILAEILTGKPPYIGSDATQIYRLASRGKLADCFIRLNDCGADVDLVQLVKYCLQLEPTDRPKHAGELALRVTAYQDSVESKLRKAEVQRAAEAARADAEASQAAAERQRAEAESARARAENKRRQTTLALAASVLLFICLAAGGWAWIKNDQDSRHAQISSEANDALNKATALSVQAEAALTGRSQLFSSARQQLQRALTLVESGPADPLLVKRVQRLQKELDQEEKDRVLADSLDLAWMAQANTDPKTNTFTDYQVVPLILEALLEYGIPVGEIDVEIAAKRILERPTKLRDTILPALFELHYQAPLLPDKEGLNRQWLRELMDDIEPEGGFLRRYFTAISHQDPAKKNRALAALAESVDESHISPQAIIALAKRLESKASIALLRRAQRRYPDDFFTNIFLADSLSQLKTYDSNEVIRYSTAAVALRPLSAGAHANLGYALGNIGEIEAEISAYQKALELEPDYLDVYINLWNALIKLNKSDEAIAAMRKAVELSPENAVYYSNLGSSLSNAGQTEEAISYFRKAIELNPNDAMSHVNMGITLQNLGQNEEAIPWYRKAFKLAPTNVEYGRLLGKVLSEHQKEFAEASEAFQKVIKLQPNHAETYLLLGNALNEQGKWKQAIDAYSKAVDLDNEEPEFIYKKGETLLLNQQSAAGFASLKASLAVEPAYAQVCVELGDSLWEKGMNKTATDLWKLVAEQVPPDSYTLGECARRMLRTPKNEKPVPDFEKALQWVQQACELEPDNDWLQSTLALAFYRTQQWQQASDTLQMILDNGTDTPQDRILFALTKWQLGQKEIARDWYGTALNWLAANESDVENDDDLKHFFSEAAAIFTPATEVKSPDNR